MYSELTALTPELQVRSCIESPFQNKFQGKRSHHRQSSVTQGPGVTENLRIFQEKDWLHKTQKV